MNARTSHVGAPTIRDLLNRDRSYRGCVPYAASELSSATDSDSSKRTTGSIGRSGYAGVGVVPAIRRLRCFPTGRRRQGITVSIAGNKRELLRQADGNWERSVPNVADASRSPDPSTVRRGLVACCVWRSYWRQSSGGLPAAAAPLYPPSLPGIGPRSAVFCRRRWAVRELAGEHEVPPERLPI
jgi:hypothetical protein